jgi:hypothetical protein
MKAWVQHGGLETRTPDGLDGSALMAAVRGFKDWAQIHGTKISDISDFYKLSQGRPPLVDENAPSQVLTQIKHRESGDAPAEPDRLFQSALFLALAHDNDMDQDEADQQLGSVAAMEADLFANISGNAQDGEESLPLTPNATSVSALRGHDVRMSGQRLQAWACLAQACSQVVPIYVTTSTDVLDHVLERYPDALQPIHWELSDSDRVLKLKQKRLKALDAYGRSNNPSTALSDGSLTGEPGSVRLALHFLAGVSPHNLLIGLSKAEMQIHEISQNPWLNTIIGLIES